MSMAPVKELYEKHKEIIRYLFWGVATTVVSWGTYSIAALLLKQFNISLSMLVTIANIISWVCAVTFAYVTNKIRVFNSRSWKKEVVFPEAIKFVSSRIATGAIEIVGVPLLVAIGLNQTVFGIEGMFSKIIVSVVVVVLNYVFSKLFVFK